MFELPSLGRRRLNYTIYNRNQSKLVCIVCRRALTMRIPRRFGSTRTTQDDDDADAGDAGRDGLCRPSVPADTSFESQIRDAQALAACTLTRSYIISGSERIHGARGRRRRRTMIVMLLFYCNITHSTCTWTGLTAVLPRRRRCAVVKCLTRVVCLPEMGIHEKNPSGFGINSVDNDVHCCQSV